MAPTVSVLLPVRDEAEHIAGVITSLLAQDHPIAEILVAEGDSSDGTADILRRLAAANPVVRVVANPDRLQSYGLNLLLAAATGEIVVRADGHTAYPPDYVRRCVAALDSSGADLVGGPMTPVGQNRMERAVAAAMTSPAAVGGARFRRDDAAGDTDTVYLGAARTATLRAHGGWRHLPSGVAEDADLAYRIRQSGGRVVLDPAIKSSYRPRSTLRALARQYHRYGRGKAEMRRLYGEFPSWRPWAPLLLLVALAAGAGLGLAGVSWWPLTVVGAAWTAALAWASRKSPTPLLTVAAVAVMHLSYGVGLIAGLLASSAVRGSPPPPHPGTGELHRDPQRGEGG